MNLYSASNIGSGVEIYSGSNQTGVINLVFYSLTGSGAISVNRNINDIEISNSSTGKTDIIYSASNTDSGYNIYSDSNISNDIIDFKFNSIAGTGSVIVNTIGNTIVLYNSVSNINLGKLQYNNINYKNNFIQPDPTFFSSATFVTPDMTYYSSAWPISGVVYLFGTFNNTVGTNKILYATMSNPTSWSQATYTLPVTDPQHQAIIGNKIYQFGGLTSGPSQTGSLLIYTASVNNPLDWGYSGAALPAGRGLGRIYVSKETGKIIIYGGVNQSSVIQNTILTASISNPLVWGTAPTTLPGVNYAQALIEAGDWIYLYGGGTIGSPVTMSNAIWRAHKTTPMVVSNSGFTLTRSLSQPCQPVQIGSYVYILANLHTTGTFRIDVNKPWAPEFISGAMCLPFSKYNAPAFIAQNKIFVMGGGPPAGNNRSSVHTSSYYITASTTYVSSNLYDSAPALETKTKKPTLYSSIEKFGASTIWQSDIDR
jgi:hypothetical protein